MYGYGYGYGMRRRSLLLAGAALLLASEAEGWAYNPIAPNPANQTMAKRVNKTPALDVFLTNAGTSPKQVYDILGNVVWSPHNLLVQSENFLAGWTNTSADPTAHTLTDNNAADFDNVAQTVATLAGATYTYAAWVLKDGVTARFIGMQVAGAALLLHINTQTGATQFEGNTLSGTVLVADTGTHWLVKITFVASGATTTFGLLPAVSTVFGTAVGAAQGSVTIDKVQLNRGTVPTAYLATTTAARVGVPITYHPVTHVCEGLFTEPAATNLILNNLAMSTQNVTVSAVPYTLSFLGTGTVTLSGVSTAGPLVGTGAADRVSLTFTPTAGTLTLTVSGTVTRGQLELGAVATSFIPTFATAQTRAADLVGLTTMAGTIPALGPEYSVLLYGELLDLGPMTLCSISDGSSNNKIAIYRNGGGSPVQQFVGSGGSTSANFSLGTDNLGATAFKIASRVRVNDFHGAKDGTLAASPDIAGAIPIAPTTFHFYEDVSNSFNPNMKVTKVAILPTRALSNTELQTNTASDTLAALLAAEAQGLFIDFTNVTTPVTVKWLPSVFADPSQFLAFAGGSPKLTPRATDGVLAWSAHNHAVRSEEFSAWTALEATVQPNVVAAPDTTITADKIVPSTNSAAHSVTSAAITVAATDYFFGVRVKAAGYSKVGIRENTSTGDWATFDLSTVAVIASSGVTSPAITALADGWFLVSFLHSNAGGQSLGIYPLNAGYAAGTPSGYSFAGDGTSGIYVWGAQLNRGPIPTRYIRTTTAALYGVAEDHHPTTFAKLGMLWEPAGTNLFIRNTEFDNASVFKDGATVTADQIVAPDGRTTADRLNETAVSSGHLCGQGPQAISSATVYAASVFAKKGTRNYLNLSLGGVTANEFIQSVFDLNLGVLGESSVGASSGTIIARSITDYGNGWYRCVLIGSLVETTTYMEIGLAPAATGNAYNTNGEATYLGVATNNLYLWGAQLELGSIATSPIPTFAAAVTRAQDIPLALLSTLPALGPAYAMYVKGNIAVLDATTKNYLALSDGTANEYAAFRGVSGVKSLSVVDGGVAQTAPLASLQTILANVDFQSTARVKANDFAISVNGEAVVKDTVGTLPTPDRLTIGSLFGTTNPMTSPLHIKSIVLANDHDILDAALPNWRYA